MTSGFMRASGSFVPELEFVAGNGVYITLQADSRKTRKTHPDLNRSLVVPLFVSNSLHANLKKDE